MDPSGMVSRQGLLSKLVVLREGEDGTGVERRVRKWGEHEELGRSSWMKNREGEKRKRNLERGRHYGVRKEPGTREIPRNIQR